MPTNADPCVAIVDDDESYGRSVCRWMNAAAFTTAIYRSAEEFLSDPDNSRFACLIVDIQLGGITGLEMRRQLVAAGSRTPVIFITAYDDSAAMAEAERTGCAFLRKTVDGAHLLDAIRSACGDTLGSEHLVH